MKSPKKAAIPLATVNIDNFQGNTSELARTQYVLAFLQLADSGRAQRAAGVGRMVHQRSVDLLAETGSLSDRPRSGRPMVYTDSQMEYAYDVLCNQEYGKLTGTALLKQLIEDGEIHTTANPDRFLKHLREFIESKGQRLITNSTQTTFFLAVKDVATRLKYAKGMVRDLAHRPIGSITFEDEVTLEQSPHPKGS